MLLTNYSTGSIVFYNNLARFRVQDCEISRDFIPTLVQPLQNHMVVLATMFTLNYLLLFLNLINIELKKL